MHFRKELLPLLADYPPVPPGLVHRLYPGRAPLRRTVPRFRPLGSTGRTDRAGRRTGVARRWKDRGTGFGRPRVQTVAAKQFWNGIRGSKECLRKRTTLLILDLSW